MTRRGTRSRLAIAGILALALCTALALTIGTAAEAKKKHKKQPRVFQQSLVVNAPVPDAPSSSGPSTPVRSTINVGKKFKGRTVADVNVLGIQTTGNDPGAANDLAMKLTAPNGRTVYLIGAEGGIGDQNIGPLTIDDDSPVSICDSANPANCEDPAQTLQRPFAGTANLQGLKETGTGGTKAFRGVPMRGPWTFTIFDTANVQTSTFNGWGLQIRAAKPVK